MPHSSNGGWNVSSTRPPVHWPSAPPQFPSRPRPRPQASPEAGPQPIPRPAQPGYTQSPQSPFNSTAVPPTPGGSGHSEKIRAVLYPNQRNWSSSPNSATFPPQQDHTPATRPS